MGKYEWKDGFSRSVAADAAGAVCEALERSGGLTPERLVDASRPDDAPLHPEFEWDDTEAAERYREIQAGGIIRQLTVAVVTSSGSEQTRAFVPTIRLDGRRRSYVGVEVAMRDPDMRSQLLADAYKDAESFERKYRQLVEVADVIAAIKRLPKADA